jgi:hypothetical protein
MVRENTMGEGHVAETTYFMENRQLKERKDQGQNNLQRNSCITLLSPVRPNLPKFPPLPKIVPLAGD